MRKAQPLYKICSRCLFRVPLTKGRCATCGGMHFAQQEQEESISKSAEPGINITLPFASTNFDWLSRLQTAVSTFRVPLEQDSRDHHH